MFIAPLITLLSAIVPFALSDSTSTAFVDNPLSISFHGDDDDYYNVGVDVGGRPFEVRLDINQPELWVMDERSFPHCSDVQNWWSSVDSQYPSSIPETVTTEALYTAGACLDQPGYQPPASMASPLVAQTNGAAVNVPYIASTNASGVWATDKVGINFTNGSVARWSNFTFIDVKESSLLYGGFGLATNPRGSGLLTSLQQSRFIKSPGYSLWFGNTTRYNVNVTTQKYGYIIPGVVDPSRYVGTLYSFPVVGHKGFRYPQEQNYDNSVVGNLNLPIVVLDNLELLNPKDGSVSFISNTNVAPFPVALSSRSIFSFLPNSILIDLAIQTNAYYSADVSRWLVGCEAIRNAQARIRFKFNDLEITMPLENLIENAIFGGKQLKFQDDQSACTLLVLSSDRNGAASLGLPFLEHVYMVMDNEAGHVALAQRQEATEDDNPARVADDAAARGNSTDNATAPDNANARAATPSSSLSKSSTTRTAASAAYIENGFIPYAESVTTDTSYVFTYSQVNSLVIDASQVPARFSGALVSDGAYIITGYYATGSGVSTVNTNPAESSSSRGEGSGNSGTVGATRAVSMAAVWTVMGFLGVICMI
ncbi:hypothetical protein DIURU_002184 [Diutina rugosa]|uniref:Peptidase A1 domain-containing protein n=1 Tax=Diutina rugosa TaxID=5481 RepID=A0A642UR28_DIURU|nr:uncharacterized protein DIURU_002184 [Diutina rugosa]KAA8903673.1 hypothetical protein DIURU_002184 [Diutina rugosa]